MNALRLGYFILIIGTSFAINSPTIKLSDGNEMPIVGFGTHYRVEEEEVKHIESAIKIGYRHFDTAYIYKNEQNLGKALKQWFDQGGKREDFFITTKLPPYGMRALDVTTYLTASLEKLGLDYIDMYLIHFPFGIVREKNLEPHIFENGTVEIDPTTDYIAVWKEMEKQVKAGRIKSIGLSNFNESQVLNVWHNAEIKPTNLQIEGNIYLQQNSLRDLCKRLNIVATAYSPLGSNKVEHVRRKRNVHDLPAPLRNPIVEIIAQKHGKTVAQILLRYLVEIGFVVIPNSGNPKRMKENLDIFNFSLTNEDLEQLKALDKHGAIRKFDLQALYPGSNKHPEYPFVDRLPSQSNH